MTDKNNNMLLSGNHAVAWGVRLARPDVSPVYPITPQTPILEKITEFKSAGEIDTELLTPESEHSAISACIGASLTGARVFTATSSQGLLLMHEMLHYAAGARAPIVMFNVNRTPASPWGFWPDQLDSLSQRDTGWVQLYTETPQESLDSVIQAFRLAEVSRLPVMLNHDAFYVSHAMEAVSVPSQQMVDDFLPKIKQEFVLDTNKGSSFGAPIDQQTWNRSRQDMAAAMAEISGLVSSIGSDWNQLTGRNYDPLESYRTKDAETVIVTMGSMCGTVREAVDAMREKGIKVGLLKIRLFRPFPAEDIRQAVEGIPNLLVLDRNYSPGMGGIVHQELKSALFGVKAPPKVHGLLAGVGGVNVSTTKIEQLVTHYQNIEPSLEPVWVE
ncbi:MAG: pyruvate ferredoxin oxidoreductase [Gammaproteobacteria bacterium]|nr:MAG: pyruvate ferredoxin oxidoreductase [Gammaproteobacteria bacterium]